MRDRAAIDADAALIASGAPDFRGCCRRRRPDRRGHVDARRTMTRCPRPRRRSRRGGSEAARGAPDEGQERAGAVPARSHRRPAGDPGGQDAFAQTLDGLALRWSRDRTGAREAFEEALRLQPEYPPALRALGRRAHDRRGQRRRDRALRARARRRSGRPDHRARPGTRLRLGRKARSGARALRECAPSRSRARAGRPRPRRESVVPRAPGRGARPVREGAGARSGIGGHAGGDPVRSRRSERGADDPEAIADLVAAIEIGDARTRTKAVELLTRTSDPGAAVLRLLDHRKSMVRVAAAGFFRKTPLDGAVGRLAELLEHDPDPLCAPRRRAL